MECMGWLNPWPHGLHLGNLADWATSISLSNRHMCISSFVMHGDCPSSSLNLHIFMLIFGWSLFIDHKNLHKCSGGQKSVNQLECDLVDVHRGTTCWFYFPYFVPFHHSFSLPLYFTLFYVFSLFLSLTFSLDLVLIVAFPLLLTFPRVADYNDNESNIIQISCWDLNTRGHTQGYFYAF